MTLDTITEYPLLETGRSDQFSRRVSRFRFSQHVACHLLAAMEVVCIGYAAFLLLQTGAMAHANILFVLSSAIATAAVYAILVFAGRAATHDHYGSALSILPGAAAGAAYIGCAARMAGAGWQDAALCAGGLLACIGVVRLLAAGIKSWLTQRGTLIRLVAIASDNAEQRSAMIRLLRQREDVEIVFAGSPAEFEALLRLVQANLLDEIVLSSQEPAGDAAVALTDLAVTVVRAAPEVGGYYGRDARRRRQRLCSPWNMPAAVICEPPLAGWGGVIKRLMDIAGSVTALIILSPLMVACAIAVKLDSPGPILFVQERAGYRNKTFRMLKFRSMRTNLTDPTGSKLTDRNDPRVTRVGAFLRRTSADELPQLFNVLRGEMSLVGPRPHPKGAKAGDVLYDLLIPNFYSRYRVKPGITGLAQISGLRGNTETERHLIDRFGRDLQYVAEWSAFLDISILMRTVSHLLKGTNAF